jgi:hypothetical protein
MHAIKKIAVKIIQVVAGIAGVAFLLMPLSTSTQVLACIGALAIAVWCTILSAGLDDDDDDADASLPKPGH